MQFVNGLLQFADSLLQFATVCYSLLQLPGGASEPPKSGNFAGRSHATRYSQFLTVSYSLRTVCYSLRADCYSLRFTRKLPEGASEPPKSENFAGRTALWHEKPTGNSRETRGSPRRCIKNPSQTRHFYIHFWPILTENSFQKPESTTDALTKITKFQPKF